MVAFSIALAASVLFICAANIINNYFDYKRNVTNNNSSTYYHKLETIDKLCEEITAKALEENNKNGYFSSSNYESVIAKIRYIINFK